MVKFHFPLPGRKASLREAEAGKSSNAEAVYNSSESRIPSKAGEFLGTTSHLSRRQSRIGPSLQATPISTNLHTHRPNLDRPSTGYSHSSSVRVEPDDNSQPSPYSQPHQMYNTPGKEQGDRPIQNGSPGVGTTKQLHNQASSSTLRSYYDAKRSPLLVSQQTSASSARDLALRKGRPTIDEALGYLGAQGSRRARHAEVPHQHAESYRSKKPGNLDLSKLFPKPADQTGIGHLLSPAKFMDSPSALSDATEFFTQNASQPQPRPAPRLRRDQFNTGTSRRPIISVTNNSTRRNDIEWDMYKNAKVNVRRPPKGIQHWFDALDEESDEASDSSDMDLEDPVLTHSSPSEPARTWPESPLRNSLHSQGRPSPVAVEPANDLTRISHNTQAMNDLSRNEKRSSFHSEAETIRSACSSHRPDTPSTKGIRPLDFAVQNGSVLNLASSDEEVDPIQHLPIIRDSCAEQIDIEDEIVVCDASEVSARPVGKPRRMRTKRSQLHDSNSTFHTVQSSDTAAIPDTEAYHAIATDHPPLPNRKKHSTIRHSKAQHAVPEDEKHYHYPNTAISAPLSHDIASPDARATPSSHASSTSRTEPRLHSSSERARLMAVTKEEQALLEMMRRKRAAMTKQSFTEGYQLAKKQEVAIRKRQSLGPATTNPRTSAFLSLDSPDGTAFPSPPSTWAVEEGVRRTSGLAAAQHMRKIKPLLPERSAEQDASTFTSATTSRPPLIPRRSSGRVPRLPQHQHNSSHLSELSAPSTRTPSPSSSSAQRGPNPYRLSPRFHFQPLDLFPSPTRSASRPWSPETQTDNGTYSSSPPSTITESTLHTATSVGKGTGLGLGLDVEIVGSDRGSGVGSPAFDGHGDGHAHGRSDARNSGVDVGLGRKKHPHVESADSFSSVSADVLAAWGALGGGAIARG